MIILKLFLRFLKALLLAMGWCAAAAGLVCATVDRIQGNTADASYHLLCVLVVLAFVALQWPPTVRKIP